VITNHKTMKIDYEIKKPSPKVHAKIYRAGRLFATGLVEVSGDDATFYPTHAKSLAISPNDKIKLKVKKTHPLLSLKTSEENIGASSDKMWFFEIDHVA
jgi:hypothetical protein